MNFFEQLSNTCAGGSLDLTIRVKEKNGKLTLSVLPNVANQAAIAPLIVTGTPQELDEQFFSAVGPAMQQAGLAVLNAAEHAKSVAAAAAPAPEKNATKEEKPTAKKDEGKKPKEEKQALPEAKESKVQEQSLFS